MVPFVYRQAARSPSLKSRWPDTSYLGNRNVNLLNLHYAITQLAISGGGVFFAVYLLRAGVPIPAILGALALLVLMRFVQRPLLLIIGKRFGLKPLLMIGTLGSALQYPVLALVHGVGAPLLALCIVAAVGDTFYWTGYHAYFAAVGTAEHRGHQLGAREAFAALAGIVGPITFGAAIVRFGPQVAWAATACVQVLAAVPLLPAPNVPVRDDARGIWRAAARGVAIFFVDGWMTASYLFVWQIALFISLGESFSSFGFAMALAALVGAAGGLLLGRHIDLGHGGRATWLALGGLAATIVLRSVSTHNAPLAVFANACGALEACLYLPTTMTVVYNQAKASPCTLRFHIATEGGWDLGHASGCLTAALLIGVGAPLGSVVLLSLAGVGPLFVLLRHHYDVRAPELRASLQT
jgi:hypothetical protein